MYFLPKLMRLKNTVNSWKLPLSFFFPFPNTMLSCQCTEEVNHPPYMTILITPSEEPPDHLSLWKVLSIFSSSTTGPRADPRRRALECIIWHVPLLWPSAEAYDVVWQFKRWHGQPHNISICYPPPGSMKNSTAVLKTTPRIPTHMTSFSPEGRSSQLII